MGPKPAAGDTEMKFVSLKVVGGEPPSNAILSAKLSPFGCNPKKLEKKFPNKPKNIQILEFTLN